MTRASLRGNPSLIKITDFTCVFLSRFLPNQFMVRNFIFK